MKLYCFQFNSFGTDYPTENGVAIAKSENEAWQLFFEKYEGYDTSLEEIERDYKIEKVLPLDEPVAWCGECVN